MGEAAEAGDRPEPAPGPRSARLLGRHHRRLGAIEAVAEGRVALALSKGGAAKTYAHVDPNEDAVCFASGAGGTLVAVADGHGGAWGAERIVDYLLSELAPRWTAEAPPVAAPGDAGAWQALGREALLGANRILLESAARERIEPAHSTLSLALVRPEGDRWLHASIGDSHVFAVDRQGVRDVAWASLERSRCFYLGYPLGKRGPESLSHVESAPLAGLEALVLCTDGLSELRIGVADPVAAVRASLAEVDRGSERAPLELCRALVERALAAQVRNRAGDNVGAAVLLLERP